jgi:hypothetical protein
VTGKRRQHGTGSLFFNARQGYWQARILLADGRRITRSFGSEDEAAAALDVLRDEYAGQLGRMYEYPRKERQAPRRPALSPRRRLEVFVRDGYRCRYCGSAPPRVVLVIDHFVSIANGGTDDMENLITACEPCNLGKGDHAVPNRHRPPISPRILADRPFAATVAGAWVPSSSPAASLHIPRRPRFP